MAYTRPSVILHVKDSGELYVPDQKTLTLPYYDKSPRVEITPGHGTLEEYLARKRQKKQQQLREQEKPKKSEFQRPQINHNRQKAVVHKHQQQRQEQQQVRRTVASPFITTSTAKTPDAWLADFSDSMPETMKGKGKGGAHSSNPKHSNHDDPVITKESLYRFQPLDLETGPSEQQSVVFRDIDIHRSSSPSSAKKEVAGNPNINTNFKFPPKTSKNRPLHHRHHNSNTKPRAQAINSSPQNNVVRHKNMTSTKNTNYNLVIGLSYDENHHVKSNEDDYDFDDTPNAIAAGRAPTATTLETEYSAGELYQLCIFEVPDYLKTQLCGGILEGRGQQFGNNHRRSSSAKIGTNAKAGSSEANKEMPAGWGKQHRRRSNDGKGTRNVAVPSVDIPPRPSNLLHVTENTQPLSYNIVNTLELAASPSSEQPTRKNEISKEKIKEYYLNKLISKNLQQHQQHAAPAVITSNSKVKIYRPVQLPTGDVPAAIPTAADSKGKIMEAPIITTADPITMSYLTDPHVITPPSGTTSKPLTTTTEFANLRRRQTLKTRRPVVIVEGKSPLRQRPLLFSKRNRHTGEVQASKPFEYFSRLAQYMGGRLRTPLNAQHQRRNTPPPPTLVRKRPRSET